MSDFYIRLIPRDPKFVPAPRAHEEAFNLMRRFIPEPCEVTAKVFEEPQFIHPGQNWEGVSCPHCGTSLEEGWWGEAMDEAYKTRWTMLEVTVPCCGARCSLNQS
jgi:hypothetical protein